MSLPTGKLPPELLERLVFGRLGARRGDVVVGPRLGEDAAVLRLPGGHYLVAHLDPITAAGGLAGWLAVHVACNDIAATGARPAWLLSLILAPRGDPQGFIDTVTRQMHEAALELGVAIVGGHTEVVEGPGLVAAAAFGVTRRPVPTGGAKPGDQIILTKTAGLEGTAILATDYEHVLRGRIGERLLEEAKRMARMVSVVREAVALAEAGLVDAMHDPTEGGVIGGVYEMSHASSLEAELWVDEVPVAEATRAIASALNVDPLRLISSGSLLAAIPPERVEEALSLLRSLGVEARVIGVFREERRPRVILTERKTGKVLGVVDRLPRDEIYRVEEELGAGANNAPRV